MKKILALALSSMLVISGAVAFSACNTEEEKPAQDNLYFVPGTYVSDGVKIENTLSNGATKLSDDVCAEMNTENVYQCTLPAGANLPVPTSQRKDKDDNLYSFNGWWAIVNATVTYYDTVPTVTETTFLYADWRADLSQRRDPIIPEGWVEVEPDHYLMVKHAGVDELERVTMREQATNMMSAEELGYGYPVELCIQGLELKPGDMFTVYTTGLSEAEEAEKAPVEDKDGRRSIQLEASTEKDNDTADYLSAPTLTTWRTEPILTYLGTETGYYNIYIKFFSGGSTMTIYLEPMA
ncbi:MAG: hypothetical protein HDQ88_08460 [Clostridia bacterium]|nr:hypothetical protein [Clostridia bacterium]